MLSPLDTFGSNMAGSHGRFIYFYFLRLSVSLSRGAELAGKSINIESGFPFLTTLSAYFVCFVALCNCDQDKIISQCSFDLHFSNCYG